MTSIRVNTPQELRFAYFCLHNIKDFSGDNGGIKRAIRQYHRAGVQQADERRIIAADFDECIELVALPCHLETEEAADEYFREREYIRPINSMYDCTGMRFTSWYKLFRRNGRWMAYHSIGIDI